MRRAWWAVILPWIAGALLLGLTSVAPAQAPEPTYRFELPAQSVGAALRLFGEITNQQIIFSEDTVRGRQSTAVVGTFTAVQALNRLLTGTGLKITRTVAGVFYIGNGTDAGTHGGAP
jgi:iron complex outermembrane recepter protein